jgi:hypothetical protein
VKWIFVGAFFSTMAGLLIWLIGLWMVRAPHALSATLGRLGGVGVAVALGLGVVGSLWLALVLAATPVIVCVCASVSMAAVRD